MVNSFICHLGTWRIRISTCNIWDSDKRRRPCNSSVGVGNRFIHGIHHRLRRCEAEALVVVDESVLTFLSL